MKDIYLWIAGTVLLVLAIAIAIGAYLFLEQSREPVQPGQQPSGGVLFPSSGAGTGTVPGETRTISLATGEKVQVEDFIGNGTTFEDPANDGSYFVAGKLEYCLADGSCPDTHTPEFSILYFEDGQSFIVSLNQEPLRTSREKAERYLMNVLGIPKAQMCNLTYTLGTTVSVNPTYGSYTNLGFSFCEGSVKLP